MEVTYVKVRPEEREGSRMKAKAFIKIDDALVIKGIRIIEGKERLFAAMPSNAIEKVNEDGETIIVHDDIVHPINQETRDKIEKAVLDEYERVLREGPDEK